jgi:hypothetical protein
VIDTSLNCRHQRSERAVARGDCRPLIQAVAADDPTVSFRYYAKWIFGFENILESKTSRHATSRLAGLATRMVSDELVFAGAWLDMLKFSPGRPLVAQHRQQR